MLGRTHVLVAGAAALAILPALPGETPARLAAGAAMAAGSALLPDLDTRMSTASRALGPVTQVVAGAIGELSGGHRRGTHSLVPVYPTILAAGALAGEHLPDATAAAGIATALILAVGLIAAGPAAMRRGGAGLAGAAVAGAWAIAHWVGYTGWWWPIAIGLGAWLHAAADALTTEGIPVIYGLSRARVRVPVTGRTGSVLEHVLAGAALVAIGLLCWHDFGAGHLAVR